MLDLYKRACPCCGAQLTKEWVRCRSCHKLLPRKLSRLRRLSENAVLVIFLVAAVVGLIAPDLGRSLLARRPPAGQPLQRPGPWRGNGPEPAARAWAVTLEPELERVCQTTFSRYADRKLVIASLTQYLPQVLHETRQPLTPEGLRFSSVEENDALVVLGDQQRFIADCLHWSYEALTRCETYKSDLGSRDATNCMVNSVQRALVTGPLVNCASAAKLERVKRACTFAAARDALLAGPSG
jgi:hypothetical protein